VLQPIPGFRPAGQVPERFDVVRAYLRLLGPATPKLVAGYLDAPLKDVQARWPDDAVEVAVDGERRWLVRDDAGRLDDPPEVTRLLGPFDLFLQARDRELLVPDPARAKEVWRTLGRPGGVLLDGEIAGTWRARKAGAAVTVAVELWSPASSAGRAAITEQADRLATFRRLTLKSVDFVG
jgi:hypothetical protein